ncbi:hypothetical protein GCM10025783_05110 [Amnibacterium soli]|uniref:FMN-binding domain-containing protein n=1 Tax=Amnibacterium soli TaxID=1282736 RepID=A0ABP8YU10_9MICO
MRRAPIVLTATVLGTAGVLLFKPLATTSTASGSPGAGDATSTSTSTGTGSSAGTATPSAAASASASASDGTGGTSTKDGTWTGEAETTRFGTTQVKATISGGRITEITTVQLNEADPRSYQISVGAAPTLRSEVLAQQTAAVDVVSGATYTSDAYEASLQSALDQAGFTAADGSKASTDVSSIQDSGGH